MRNLLALLGLVIVVFLSVGYARGWYSFDVSTGSDGKVKISGDIDGTKIKEDGGKTLDAAGDAIDKVRHKSPASAQSPATPPGKDK